MSIAPIYYIYNYYANTIDVFIPFGPNMDTISSENIKKILKLGYNINYITQNDIPIEKALSLLNNNEIDVDLFRVAGLEDKYENIIQSSVPIIKVDLIATSKYDIDLENINQYNIGAIYGHQSAFEYTQQYDNVFFYRTYELVINALNDEKIDLIIWFHTDLFGNDYEVFADQLGLELINYTENVFQSQYLYVYVNKSRKDLLRQIEENILMYK